MPSSGVGTPNATFNYDRATYTSTDAVSGYPLVSNGITFELASDAAGHDYTEACPGNGACGSIAVDINQPNVTNVYTIISAYFGQSFSATFTGTGGASQSFTGIFVPDFCNGDVNSNSGGVTAFTVFRVHDVGGCGTGNSATGSNTNYDLTEVGFTLSSAFQGQTLASMSITPNSQNILLMATTVVTAAGTTAPEPGTFAMFGIGAGFIGIAARRKRQRG